MYTARGAAPAGEGSSSLEMARDEHMAVETGPAAMALDPEAGPAAAVVALLRSFFHDYTSISVDAVRQARSTTNDHAVSSGWQEKLVSEARHTYNHCLEHHDATQGAHGSDVDAMRIVTHMRALCLA